MNFAHNSRMNVKPKQGLRIAICVAAALLCASCATGARNKPDEKNPKEIAQLYVDLGTQALMRGEFPQAVEDFRKALLINSENATARNHLGLAYYALGKKELAKAEIQRSLTIDAQYSDAYVNLGKIAEDANNYTLAKHYYNKALDNLEYKTRHRALTNLAALAVRENNTEEAKKLLYRSLQANPEFCLSHFLLGSVLMRENKTDNAAEAFKRSVANTCASNVEGHYQLGLAYLKSKNFNKARSQFVYLVEQFPQTVEAQRAGEQLRTIP